MFFTPWYNAMLVIIFATALYQKHWMKVNGYTLAEPYPMSGRILSLLLMFIPILNTIFGLLSLLMLFLYTFNEEVIIESFESGDRFKKL